MLWDGVEGTMEGEHVRCKGCVWKRDVLLVSSLKVNGLIQRDVEISRTCLGSLKWYFGSKKPGHEKIGKERCKQACFELF